MSDELLSADDQVAAFKRAIEAVVLVAQDPVAPELLAQLLEQPVVLVEQWCDALRHEYEAQGRGFQLARVAGGYRYQTHPEQTPYVERFVLHDQKARLSGAALETLAIIAYKQPISRAQVAQVRGVNVDGVVKTLEQRGYIAEIGRDPGPGNPSLFGTTDAFLEKLGLASLADLPPIAGFVPGPDVVEQLEQGLRAEIDAETAAYVADLAERADEAAAEEAGEDDEGVEGGPAAPVDVVAVEVTESDEGVTVETVEVVDHVETDDDGVVTETLEVIDDTITLTDDGHLVEVIDTTTESVTVTPDGDVVDVVDETIVVVADGEVVLEAEVVVEVDEVDVDDDAIEPADRDGSDEPVGDDEPAPADPTVDDVAPGATERDPDVPPT